MDCSHLLLPTPRITLWISGSVNLVTFTLLMILDVSSVAGTPFPKTYQYTDMPAKRCPRPDSVDLRKDYVDALSYVPCSPEFFCHNFVGFQSSIFSHIPRQIQAM
ncbi:hypothetical protein CVT25_011330 [Psilocybe cyanescens]|uniref:Uncharacterized protein n=1 Tax=Psilocybe cyanescens TaxID=93625 RepID=A0A409WGB3_PSICY|nr:hypothetical protein CVT25_011330 [Psilocybe cyanescens]